MKNFKIMTRREVRKMRDKSRVPKIDVKHNKEPNISVQIANQLMTKEEQLRHWLEGFLIGVGVREDLSKPLAARIVIECTERLY